MSDDLGLSTYTELAEILDRLPLLIRERRRADRLSLRSAARETGVDFTTLARWENGEIGRSVALVQAVLRWLDEPHPARSPHTEREEDESRG